MNLAIANATPGENGDDRQTPFSSLANKQLGRKMTGGKPDDTTVVVGYVYARGPTVSPANGKWRSKTKFRS